MKLKPLAWFVSSALLCIGSISSTAAQAQATATSTKYNQSDFGGVGLMQTPTARMNDEGEFTLHYADNEQFRRMAVSLQVFPWLEATARYTDEREQLYSDDPNFSGNQTYKDKGFDAKFRLWQESEYMPQIALGLKDMGGTGLYAAEYVVTNKRFGDFDISLGIGWGYLGRRDNISNPFCEIADKFCERPSGFSVGAGDFEVKELFRGSAAVFGGVQYFTPINGLRLMAEYEGNNYKNERVENPIKVDSPWNFGASYQVNNELDLSVSYQRGNTLMFGVSYAINLNTISQVKREPEPRKVAYAEAQNLNDVDYARLSEDLLKETGYRVHGIETDEQQQRVTLYSTQMRYRDEELAADKAARILASTLPESVKRYEIATTEHGLAQKQQNINADLFKDAARGERFFAETDRAISTGEVRYSQNREEQRLYTRKEQETFKFSISPDLDQAFGSPETFYLYQLSLAASADWQPTANFSVDSSIGINLLNKYDEFNFLVDFYDTPLPRVRTRIREYAQGNDIWLKNLQATYTHQLSRDWFGLAYGGYLERMFAGVGGEVLYRPLGSNFSFGVDLNYVKQRDPNSITGLEDYDVLTGHASIYWQLPYLDDTLLTLKAGRFLAKDEGVQVDFAHKFDSGVIAGAYAAFTNVSAEDYGEGGFTKGFYINVPFDLFFVTYTKMRGNIGWNPITRDGGQLLNRSRQLYHMTDR